jgi:hypothetical protein
MSDIPWKSKSGHSAIKSHKQIPYGDAGATRHLKVFPPTACRSGTCDPGKPIILRDVATEERSNTSAKVIPMLHIASWMVFPNYIEGHILRSTLMSGG